MKRLKELRETRATKQEELRKLSATLETENRGMTDEEMTNVESIETELDKFTREISSLEKLEAENKRAAANQIPAVMTVDDGAQREIDKNFSMADVLKAGNGENTTGFLREMHEEGKKEMKESGGEVGGGIVIPTRALISARKMQKRANQVAGTNNVGGFLVETENVGGVIEYLGERLVLSQMGAQMFNFTGNASFNSGTTGLTTTWEGETDEAAETSETFSQFTYSPNRLAGWTNISKQLVHQANPSISTYLNNEIQKAFARAWQKAAIHGNGVNISGIAGTTGIGSVEGGTDGLAPAWQHFVDLLKELAIDNADDGSLAYLTNAKVSAKLQTTPKQASGVEGNFILNNRGDTVNGLPMYVTNSVRSNLDKGGSTGICSAIIAGNFADLGMASFGGLEIFFDPYTEAKNGMSVMHVNGYVDTNVHRPQSFAAMLDALTS